MNDLLCDKLLRQLTKVPGVEAVALLSGGELEAICPREGPAVRILAASSRALQDLVDGFQMFDASPASVSVQLDDVNLIVEPMAQRWLVVAANAALQRSLFDLTAGLVRSKLEEALAVQNEARIYAVP